MVYDALTFALDFNTAAKFLLVVEKDASFQHVVGSSFIETTGPCIVATVSSAHCKNILNVILWYQSTNC